MAVTPTGPAHVHPPRVRAGDQVSLLSLSGPLAARCPRRLDRSAAELRRRGLRVTADPTTRFDTGTGAGSAAQRAQALTRCFRDSDTRIALTTIGGRGARDLVEHLDPDELAAHPTALVGYSDATSLLLWLHERAGIVTFYGPAALPQFGEADGCDEYTWRNVATCLSGEAPLEMPHSPTVVVEQLSWDMGDTRPRLRRPAPPRRVLAPGQGCGRLMAANIATLAGDLRAGLVGSDWADHVVFLEESDTASWASFTADVATIAGSGLLDGITALVVGRFRQVLVGEWAPTVVREVLAPLATGPFVGDVEFGHTDPVLTLPIGASVEVIASDTEARIVMRTAAVR